MTSFPSQPKAFQTTHWSVVLSAARRDPERPVADDQRQAALNELAARYWYPLYAYLRRKGHSTEDASDLTQGFFVQLLEKNTLEAVDPRRGKFRWFLMSAVQRYAQGQAKAQRALKRGGGVAHFSLDVEDGERRYRIEPVDVVDPQALFERRWALTLLEAALADVESEFAEQGQRERYQALRPFLLPGGEGSYEQAAEQLMLSTAATKVAVHRLRDRYARQLRHRIAQTLDENSSIDEELGDLLRALDPTAK